MLGGRCVLDGEKKSISIFNQIKSLLVATAFVAFAVICFQKVALAPWVLGWASVGGALGALTRSIWLGVCAAVCLAISFAVVLVCNFISVWF
jgi:hypothetical protein